MPLGLHFVATGLCLSVGIIRFGPPTPRSTAKSGVATRKPVLCVGAPPAMRKIDPGGGEVRLISPDASVGRSAPLSERIAARSPGLG